MCLSHSVLDELIYTEDQTQDFADVLVITYTNIYVKTAGLDSNTKDTV